MPLAISVMRKYLPSLSRVLSLSPAHSTGLLVLNPFGGGPMGVA